MFSVLLRRLAICGVMLGNLVALAECQFQFEQPVVVGVVKPDSAAEISGLAVSRRNPGVLWVHNDGSSGKILALSVAGELLATYSISRPVNDLEDIAFGPGPDTTRDYLYFGDIGSNTRMRNTVRIYRTAEPLVSLAWVTNPKSPKFGDVERFELIYPDDESHDAEGFFVDPVTGDLFVFSKDPGESQVFRAARQQLVAETSTTLERMGLAPFSSVSSAAISRDGRYVAVRREGAARLWVRQPGQTVGEALQSEGLNLPVVGLPREPNGEALCFDPSGTGYFTLSEGQNAEIFRFAFENNPLESGNLASPVLQDGIWSFAIRVCPESVVWVEKSTDLKTWVMIEELYLEGGIGTFSEPAGTGGFYRLRSVN